VLGTAGDDVILTNGAARVDSGAGDDVICLTGSGPVVVNAGPGDDFVDARAHRGKTFVSLGFGNDTFLGGPGADRVWSQEAANQTASEDHDVVITNGGDDVVFSGSSRAPNADVVLLGPGDDTLVTYGPSNAAVLDGGLGTNTLRPLPAPDDSGDWLFDNVAGQATLDGASWLVWRSFQHFELTGLPGEWLRFWGSRAAETVLAGGTCRAELRGRGGDDRLTVADNGCNGLPAGDALLVGGPGDDHLTGSLGDDILRGGRGWDVADGGPGADHCTAEVRISCR